jgi:hypothetical protein
MSRIRRRRSAFWLFAHLVVIASTPPSPSPVLGSEPPAAAVYRDGFDTSEPSWKVSADSTQAVNLRSRRRSEQLVHEGSRAEVVQLFATQRGGIAYLEQAVPPALVFDELTASVWLRSSRPGMQVGVRIVFPQQIDPRTSVPLTADFWGETYTNSQRWQQLRCRTNDDEIRKLLGRVRAQVTPVIETADIDAHGMSVDRVILRHSIEAGDSEYVLDALELSPYIDPASNGAGIVQAGVEQEVVSPVTMGDGHLLRDGRPLYPVFTRYHGEPLNRLRQAGFNLVMIPAHDDLPLLKSLAEAGLGAICEPPALKVRPSEETGDEAYNVGLPRFGAETENILMWHLGTEVRPEALASVRAAASAVRDADRYRRPILVDVQGNVRDFHRAVDVVGYSKHTMQTSVSPQDYFRFLQQESLASLRGKPTLTWVFPEPNPANFSNRPADAVPPQLEPEQIWMQVYAAIGAGAKGIGYWGHQPLTDDSPAGIERRHAITLANLQLFLLRDWLATGRVQGLAAVRLGTTRAPVPPGAMQSLLGAFDKAQANTGARDALDAVVKVPVIQCDLGLLILPQWLEPNGQFQPGPMRAKDVHIQLTGVGSFVHAWEVTTTGIFAHKLKVDAGEITLQQLDQAAAIIIPTDTTTVDALQRDVAAVRGAAAEAWIGLAEMKLKRVVGVHDQLLPLELKPDADGDALLSAARRWLHDGQRHLQAGQTDAARIAALEVLRLTRIVQRAHWDHAAGAVSTPVASPYTICFTTLPDFWRMAQIMGRARVRPDNLMRAGGFESWDNLLAADWKHHVLDEADGVETLIGLKNDGVKGNCLRLAARPTSAEDAPAVLDEPPIVFVSEPVSVESGQVLHIRGYVRIDSPVASGRDGLMLYDSLSGSVGAVRWMSGAPTGQWLPFEVMRPAQTSGEMRLTIELSGFGDVRIDELQVTVLEPGA